MRNLKENDDAQVTLYEGLSGEKLVSTRTVCRDHWNSWQADQWP